MLFSLLSLVVFLMIVTILLAKIYFRLTNGTCRSSKDMTGKIILITGGNSGIGKEYVRDMARRNATIIMACRDTRKARDCAQEIIQETGNVNIEVEQLDLSSLTNVSQFCDRIERNKKVVDVLVCFAAAVSASDAFTTDGLETQFQCNYLSHFLIIVRLYGLLLKSDQPKIILTSSAAHLLGSVDIHNIARLALYPRSAFLLYSDSKLCFVLLAREMSERLKNSNTNLTVNSFHPGTVKTDGIKNNRIWYLRYFLSFLAFLYGKSYEDGAQSMIHLTVWSSGVSGLYFADCRPARANSLVDDYKVRQQLWDLSFQLIQPFLPDSIQLNSIR